MMRRLILMGGAAAAAVAAGLGAWVWYHPAGPLRAVLMAAGDPRAVRVAPLRGRPVLGHPGYVTVPVRRPDGRVARPAPRGRPAGSPLPLASPPFTGALPPTPHNVTLAPGFRPALLSAAQAPATFLGGLDAAGTALVAEEAAYADWTGNLALLASLAGPQATQATIDGLAGVVAQGEQEDGPSTVYSFRVTGIALNVADTDATGSPGALPVWNVSFVSRVADPRHWTGIRTLAGTVAIATAVRWPHGVLNSIVQMQNHFVTP